MNKQWNDALDQVKDEHLAEAVTYRPKRHWIMLVSTMAAILILVVSWSVLRPDPLATDVTMDAPRETTTAVNTSTTPTVANDHTPSDGGGQDTPTFPLPQATEPIPTLPLPEETKPIPTLPLPEEPTSPTFPTTENIPPINIPYGTITSPHLLSLPNLVTAPTYPKQPKRPDPSDYSDRYQLQAAQEYWRYQLSLQKVTSPDNVRDLDPFMKSAVTQFLSGNGNRVCSPLNMYFALAMLAETTEGSSRQQILGLLGHSSIESLRAQSKQLWQAHFFDNGVTTSVLANSLWLDERFNFHQSALSNLSSNYFASVFKGNLGSNSMNQQLSAWLNSQTGNLLSDYTQNIQLDPTTVFSLASTTYFSADWEHTFSESATSKEVFHCNGYDVNKDFMHTTFRDQAYYYDPIFSAIRLSLADGYSMWLILPDEGYSPADVLKQGNYYQLISSPRQWPGVGRYKVNLSLPKFDISSEQELTSGLKSMGITDVFTSNANFSPITNAELSVGKVSHAARVCIDEEGIIAAAYTIIEGPGAAAPPDDEVDFIVNRPFLFAITGRDDLPLFAGVVAEP
jgi:serine protease inhibitor